MDGQTDRWTDDQLTQCLSRPTVDGGGIKMVLFAHTQVQMNITCSQ